ILRYGIVKYIKINNSDEVKKAKMKIVAVLLEHNIPFRIMDHLSDVIQQHFTIQKLQNYFQVNEQSLQQLPIMC
ncbi:hypothetical protein NQ314_002296, partial [Rhamnusium bicolor]